MCTFLAPTPIKKGGVEPPFLSVLLLEHALDAAPGADLGSGGLTRIVTLETIGTSAEVADRLINLRVWNCAVTNVRSAHLRMGDNADHPVGIDPAESRDTHRSGLALIPGVGDTITREVDVSDGQIAAARESAARAFPHHAVLQSLIFNKVEEHREEVDIDPGMCGDDIAAATDAGEVLGA